MIKKLQKACLSTRLGIPMIYGIDAIHGHNTAYNATIFPHNIGLGATRQVYSDLYLCSDVSLNFFEISVFCLLETQLYGPGA